MTIKDLQAAHAADLADRIMELPSLERNALRNTIEAYLSIYSMDMSKKKILNLTNTLEQLKENLAVATVPEEIQKLKKKIKEIQETMNNNNVIITESRRLNSYKRLRTKLAEKGLDDIIEEFDKETMELKEKEDNAFI